MTLTTTVDATNLVNLRAPVQGRAGRRRRRSVGYTDFLVKLAAVALREAPDAERPLGRRPDRLVRRGIHIGIAVDTEAGLLVPVIRDVPGLALRQVAAGRAT